MADYPESTEPATCLQKFRGRYNTMGA